MKNIVRNILILIIVGLIILVTYQKYHYDKVMSGSESNNYVTHQYECSFIKTFRIVNLLDDDIAEVPEWSYIVVDQFQNHEVVALKVPSRLKEGLEEGKYYEFKYMIVGTGSINSIDDINKYITLDEAIINRLSDEVKVYLTIRETALEGLEQKNQHICQSGGQMVFLD